MKKLIEKTEKFRIKEFKSREEQIEYKNNLLKQIKEEEDKINQKIKELEQLKFDLLKAQWNLEI